MERRREKKGSVPTHIPPPTHTHSCHGATPTAGLSKEALLYLDCPHHLCSCVWYPGSCWPRQPAVAVVGWSSHMNWSMNTVQECERVETTGGERRMTRKGRREGGREGEREVPFPSSNRAHHSSNTCCCVRSCTAVQIAAVASPCPGAARLSSPALGV